MKQASWAVEIKEENFCAIISEAGGNLTREELHDWLEKFELGYFIRVYDDPVFDCKLLTEIVFEDLYVWRYPSDEAALFRETRKRKRSWKDGG